MIRICICIHYYELQCMYARKRFSPESSEPVNQLVRAYSHLMQLQFESRAYDQAVFENKFKNSSCCLQWMAFEKLQPKKV